jgi:protein-disulfide isomerase
MAIGLPITIGALIVAVSLWMSAERASHPASPIAAPLNRALVVGYDHLARQPLIHSAVAPAARDQPTTPGEDTDLRAMYGLPSITLDGESGAAWPSSTLIDALSRCFFEQRAGQQWDLAVEVNDSKIAAVTLHPFEGDSEYLAIRTADDSPVALAASQLLASLRAGTVLIPYRDALGSGTTDTAMRAGEFSSLCARAHLERQPLPARDGQHALQVSFKRITPRKIDRQAYADLDVVTGASRGPANAAVTFVVFLDIADRYGAMVVRALTEVLSRYPLDVRVVIKLCPMKQPGHLLAAQAVYAANAQGALWPMLELLAANKDALEFKELSAHAATLHLDGSQFQSDIQERTLLRLIELDDAERVALDIKALPTVLINGKRVTGARPTAEYLQAVETALTATLRPR